MPRRPISSPKLSRKEWMPGGVLPGGVLPRRVSPQTRQLKNWSHLGPTFATWHLWPAARAGRASAGTSWAHSLSPPLCIVHSRPAAALALVNNLATGLNIHIVCSRARRALPAASARAARGQARPLDVFGRWPVKAGRWRAGLRGACASAAPASRTRGPWPMAATLAASALPRPPKAAGCGTPAAAAKALQHLTSRTRHAKAAGCSSALLLPVQVDSLPDQPAGATLPAGCSGAHTPQHSLAPPCAFCVALPSCARVLARLHLPIASATRFATA